MLRMLDSKDPETVKKLSYGSILGTRIYCYALCYGFDRDFLDFWAGENTLVARFDDTFTVKAGSDADFEELKEFLDVMDATEIVTDEDTAKSLCFENFRTRKGYRFTGAACASDEVSVLDDSLIPELYSLISEAIPDSFGKDRNSYLSFLSDYMFRKNRGFSRACGVISDGKLVSTTITSAETETSAIISGIACREGYRKYGFGKKTVLTIASILKNENKNVYVIALNESAEGFYEHIGFEKCENIAYVSKRCKNV